MTIISRSVSSTVKSVIPSHSPGPLPWGRISVINLPRRGNSSIFLSCMSNRKIRSGVSTILFIILIRERSVVSGNMISQSANQVVSVYTASLKSACTTAGCIFSRQHTKAKYIPIIRPVFTILEFSL